MTLNNKKLFLGLSMLSSVLKDTDVTMTTDLY